MNRCGCEHATTESTKSRWGWVWVFPFVLAIRAYQVVLAPLMSGHCRFIPTCSNYAIDAYKEHGPIRGSWLTLRRLVRCNPWGGTGYDPVPLKDSAQHTVHSSHSERDAG